MEGIEPHRATDLPNSFFRTAGKSQNEPKLRNAMCVIWILDRAALQMEQRLIMLLPIQIALAEKLVAAAFGRIQSDPREREIVGADLDRVGRVGKAMLYQQHQGEIGMCQSELRVELHCALEQLASQPIVVGTIAERMLLTSQQALICRQAAGAPSFGALDLRLFQPAGDGRDNRLHDLVLKRK